MLFAPVAALGIMLAEGQGGIFQFQVQAGRIRNFGPVNEGGKQAFDLGFSWLSLNQLVPC